MSIKTVSTISTPFDLSSDMPRKAANWSLGLDAHLDVVCLGVDTSVSEAWTSGMGDFPSSMYKVSASQDAEEVARKVTETIGDTGVRFSTILAESAVSGIGETLARRAKCTDLMLLPQPYSADASPLDETIAEAALFAADLPVCFLPVKSVGMTGKAPAIIAWDESPRAMRAVRAALSTLRKGQDVKVVMVAPPSHASDRSDPGGSLAQMLIRHGLRVEVVVLAQTLPTVGAVLRRHATDIGAELIVMGAYGHSRMRERLFGGTTRDLLENCETNLLLKH